MSKWEEVKLGEIATFKNGLNFNKGDFGTGLKIINVSNFQDYSTPRYNELPEIDAKGLANDDYLLKENDILFVRSNGNKELVGRSMFIKNIQEAITFSGFCIRARLESPNTYPKFYAHVFRGDFIRKTISAHAGGANINNLNQTILQNLKVPLPPLPVQRQIAGILSSYDDLIENNLRRISLLEEAARLEYQLLMQEKDETWEVKRLGEVLDLKYGKALKADIRIDGDYPVFGSSGQVGTHNQAIVNGPGVIVGRKGNVGTVFWSDSDFYPIDTVYYVNSQLDLRFLYLNLQTQHFVDGDAAVPGLNRSHALANPIVLPPDSEIKNFSERIKPMFRLQSNLIQQNARLKAARDGLLPGLMSGALAVPEPATLEP